MDIWGGLAAGGTAALIFFVVWLAVVVGSAALGLWLLYTVIWRAVRRGLREYHGAAGTASLYPPEWTAPPRHVEKRRERRTPPPIRPDAGPRDWSPKGGPLFE